MASCSRWPSTWPRPSVNALCARHARRGLRSDLRRLPAHPRCRQLGLRLSAGHRSPRPPALGLRHCGTGLATGGPCTHHTPSHRCLGRSTPARSPSFRAASDLSDPRQRQHVRPSRRPGGRGARYREPRHGVPRAQDACRLRAVLGQHPPGGPRPPTHPESGPPAASRAHMCLLLQRAAPSKSLRQGGPLQPSQRTRGVSRSCRS